MVMKTIYFPVHSIIVEIQSLQALRIIHVVFGKMKIQKVLTEERATKSSSRFISKKS
jgi:hypothetical protein